MASVIRAISKHKALTIVVWLCLGAATLVAIHQLPALYRSEAVVLVDSQKIPEKYVSSTVNTEVQDRLATINQQILSSTRLKKIIEDFDLYHKERKSHVEEEIIDMMRKDVQIKLERGWTGNRPGAFRIAYQGPNATVVAEVVNRIANLYIEENLRSREVQAEGTYDFIENQLQTAKQQLDKMEAALSRYKLQHNGELPQQESTLAGALARLQTELQGNQDALNRAYQNKVMLESALRVLESAEQAMTEINSRQPAAAPVRPAGKPVKRSDVIQAQIALLRVRYSDDHPDIKRLREELARMKQAEEEALAKSKPDPSAVPQDANIQAEAAPAEAAPGQPDMVAIEASQRRDSLKAQLKLANGEIASRTKERDRILRDIAAYQHKMERLPIREQELAGLTRDYEISKANYRSLLDKRLTAGMAADMERRQKSERFTILDPAKVSERPFSPNRPLLSVLGCALALLIGLAAAVGVEWKADVFLGEWELTPGIPVIARVPLIALTAREAGTRRTRRWRVAVLGSAALSLGFAVAGIFWFVRS